MDVMGRLAGRQAEGGRAKHAAVVGKVAGKGGEKVGRRAPWGADSEGVEESAHGGGVGAGWCAPADRCRVGWRAVQGVQGPWSGGDEAREMRVQGLRLLGRPVPDRGERSAFVPDERLGSQVEGCARDGVGGLGRDESAS